MPKVVEWEFLTNEISGGASEESSKDHLVPKKVYYNVALCFGGLKNAPWDAMDFHDFMCVREFSSKTETA